MTRTARTLTAAAIAAVALAAAGCGGNGGFHHPTQPGGSQATTTSAAQATTDLEHSIASRYQDEDGSTWRDLTCVPQTATIYVCAGTFQASVAHAKAQFAGTNPPANTDWTSVVEQQSGPTTITVTVAPDGTWVTQAG
jgi:hypothetical protein